MTKVDAHDVSKKEQTCGFLISSRSVFVSKKPEFSCICTYKDIYFIFDCELLGLLTHTQHISRIYFWSFPVSLLKMADVVIVNGSKEQLYLIGHAVWPWLGGGITHQGYQPYVEEPSWVW